MQSKPFAKCFAWPSSRVAKQLGIKYPIIQGPLGGLSSQRLAAAVSNFGGLGSFGAHGLDPEAIQEVIAEIRSLTVEPFAMNLWVSMEDEGAFASDEKAFRKSLSPLLKHLEDLGVPVPEFKPYKPIRFEDQVRVLLDAKVPVFSFILGIPPKEILQECRQQGIITIGTATSVDEALTLQSAEVDLIVASGFEAGGHRGAFLHPAEEGLMGTFSLVPQVSDAVTIPVIAAGGVADARGVIAAFLLGAEGVQIGTAFLTSEESGASPLYRQALLGPAAAKTALTKGFTGRLARGIENQLMQELNRPEAKILLYPLQRALLKNLSVPAEKAGRTELLPLWAGQSATLSHAKDAVSFLDNLTRDVKSMIRAGFREATPEN